MNGAWWFIATIIFDLLGGLMIRDAVMDFKKERYFFFGVDVMMAASACAGVVLIMASYLVI